MKRIQLKCIHCDTTVASAARYCPGCQAELCRGAPLKLYVFALVGAVIIGGVCVRLRYLRTDGGADG